jgi:hypothetical protein
VVRLERSRERVRPEREDVVGLDRAEVLEPVARELDRLIDRGMRLARRVDRELRAVARSRAVSSATSVAVEAVSWMTPTQPAGRSSICRNQSITTCSSSVAAGEVTQDIPWAPSVAVSISPRIEGGLLLQGK